MSSTVTRTRSVRLPNDVCDWIEREDIPLRSVLESLYDGIQRGNIVLRNGSISSDLSKYGLTTDIIAYFEPIIKLYGMNFGEFFKVLMGKIDRGEIDLEELLDAE